MQLSKLIVIMFSIISATCYSSSHLSNIPFILEQGQYSNESNQFHIDEKITQKYSAAAKFVGRVAQSQNKTVETNLVTYETTSLGVQCHVGWYADGYIGTALDGTEQGKQVVFLNNAVVGISYDIEIKQNYFVHKYTWGKVYSYPQRQVVIFN